MRPHLSVERIFLQLIDTLEIMSVALCHNQTIFLSHEEVGLIKYLMTSQPEVPCSVDNDIGAPFPIHTTSCGFLLVSVEINNQGKPESVDLILRKSIEIRLLFQVVVGCPVLLPLKPDLELKLYGVVLFFYGDNFVQSY